MTGDPTAMKCLSCYATTTNGLALCERCRARVLVDLEFLPVYFRNLARWRPGRAGARPVPGSREPKNVGVAADDRISRALDEVGNDVTGWLRALIEDRGAELRDDIDSEVEQFAAACALLAEHLTSIATLEWAGEFVAAVGRAEAWLRGLTEKAAPGWYAGVCRRKVSMESTCGADTFVVPGLTWVTCGRCGATTHAADHLEAILDEARGWVARPKAIAEAVVALVDTEQSVPKVYTRIRQWAHQGDLDSIRPTRRGYVWSSEEERVIVGTEEYGYPKYRFGDVLDRVLTADDTPSEDHVRAS